MSRSRAYLAWVVLCLVWGTTYLAIRVAIESIPPLLMAGARWIVAGTLLIAFFRLRGQRLPGKHEWRSLVAQSLLLIGLGNGAVVWAEQTVPTGLTAVLVAINPFWMVGIDALIGDRKAPTPRQVTGLLIGFFGIVLLMSPESMAVGARGFWSGFIATQLACVGWSTGSSYARQRAREQKDEHTLLTVAIEMLFGGLILLGCGVLMGEKVVFLTVTPRSGAAFAYLIVFGSIIAFSCYRYALQHLPVATLSLYVYANTVIAVLLGVLVLGEPFSWRMGLGAAVVLAGIGLVKDA